MFSFSFLKIALVPQQHVTYASWSGQVKTPILGLPSELPVCMAQETRMGTLKYRLHMCFEEESVKWDRNFRSV